MTSWREVIEEEWNRRAAGAPQGARFPLMADAFDAGDILAATEALLGVVLTMHDRVRAFEKRFAERLGVPYAVMVNSGSSANLLAVAAACNPARSAPLRPGDEVLVPAVCWSTSLWPLVQYGLRPVLVDADPDTLNLSIPDARRRLTNRTRAIMAVHVLGNSCAVDELQSLAADNGLLLIEDSCESLLSSANGKALGTFGKFGTFSFYYSHHITTGEGGMIVCSDAADYDLLRTLRAHGWTREQSNRGEIEAAHPDLDPRFLFANAGYNVRPMEVQAAIGMRQLDRFDDMANARNTNRARLVEAVRKHPGWRGQFTFPMAASGTTPVWFGFTALLADSRDRREFLRALEARGIENRPILSGNFARQPGLRLFGIDVDPNDYPGAETIHKRGFFIGLHSALLDDATIEELAGILVTT